MKSFHLLSKFFLSLLLLGGFAVSGWGACTGTNTGSWNTSTTTYNKNNQTVQSDAPDYYVITVASSGTLNLTVTNDDLSQDLTANLYSDGTCGTSVWNQSINDGNQGTTSQSVTAGTYTLRLVGSSSSRDTDYDLSGTFTPQDSGGTDPIQAPTQDICYDAITYDGFCMNMFGMQFGMNCKQTIPLRNISGTTLSDVEAIMDTSGLSGDFLGDCGVDGTSGNCSEVSSIDIGPFDMFNSAITYDLPDYTSGATHTIYESSLMSMSIFSDDNLFATYVKNGTLYASEIVACASTVPITSDNERDFTLQYSVNEVGDMVLFGNTILCKSSKQNDSSYKTGNCVAPAASDSNDNIHTLYSKLSSDSSDSTIFNSSSSDLTIPAGSEVLWATLYWQGGINGSTIDTATGDSSLTDLNAAMQRAKTVKLKTPTGAYTTVTTNPTKFNWKHSGATYVYYQGAANVTSLVQQSGTYQVANIVTNDGDLNGGTGPYGGWALMVVYKDVTSGTSKLKNMVVYDGYKLVNSDITQTLSGFYTPPSGDVNAKFTTFAAEADATRTDRITMTNKTGTEVQVASNELDSSIEDSSGATVLTRTPNFGNTIGTDIHTWNVGNTGTNAKNIIGNAQSSTNVRFDYGTDIFNLGAFSFATDLYQPEVCYIENIFKDGIKISGQGVQVNRGDQIDVRVYVKNKGDEVAQKVQVFHQFDSEFEYVEDSANYNNANPPYEDTLSTTYTKTAATDELDADLYAYDLGATTSRVNLGTGADASNGGEFAASEAFAAVFEYSGTVEAIDSNYSNTYKVAFKNEDLGLDYTNNPLTMEPCEGERNSFWGYYNPSMSGDFAIVHKTYHETLGSTNIPTQIVSKSDNFKILAYETGTTTLKDVNTTVFYEVVDGSSYGDCATMSLLDSSPIMKIFLNTNTVEFSEDFNQTAAKKAYLRIWWNMDFDDKLLQLEEVSPGMYKLPNFPNYAAGQQCGAGFVIPSGNSDQVVTWCGNNGGGQGNNGMDEDELKTCMQCLFGLNTGFACSDKFAIRPNNFDSNLTLMQPYKAGSLTSIEFYADKYNGVGTNSYNEAEHTSFIVDVNISDGSKTCQDMNISFNPNIAFTDGNATGNYTLNNIGDFNVTIHEIVGSEFAKVDENDTSPVDRLITPYTQQIKVIPHHFDVNGTLSNGSTGFTYLHNNDNNATLDQNISAILNVLVVAKSALDTNTSNYAGDCYAQNGNSTIGFVFTPEITPNGALTQLLWYDDNNHSALGASQNIVDNNRSTGIFSHPPVRFTSGVGSLRYRINFDRKVTQTLNPFMMSIPQVDVEDNDNVTGSTTPPIDNNATYVYGRVIARDVRIFGQKPFIANAWHEAFSQTPLTIGATALAPSRTDTNWYIMAPHSDAVDGDANVTHMQTNGAVATGAPLFDTVTYVSGIETYEENTGWPLNRYKAHILTAPWLWYGVNALDYANPATGDDENACLTHPCFNINVVPAVGATGSAKEDAADNKANKRTNKNTTGWKSTSDYAPAVR